jgi:hypothetical protein
VYTADLAVPPLASNLNWTAGSPPIPNQVTVALSRDGAINVYNQAGTVDVVIDVVGYYRQRNFYEGHTTEAVQLGYLPIAQPISSLIPEQEGRYLVSYAATVSNRTDGVGDMFSCGVTSGLVAYPSQPSVGEFHSVWLESPTAKVGTVSGQSVLYFQKGALHTFAVELMCWHATDQPGALFTVEPGASITALEVG